MPGDEFAPVHQAAGTQPTAVQPGPIPASGAPAPSEIVCVEVEKVFDYCFQEVTVQRTLPAPAVPVGMPLRCQLNTRGASCHVLSAQPGQEELRHVNMTVTVPGTVEVGENTAIPFTFVVFKSVQLYAPEGTQVHCGVTGSCMADLIDLNGDGQAEEVGAQANLCIVIQSKASVKLLVPAYGLCVPGPVRETPAHGLPN